MIPKRTEKKQKGKDNSNQLPRTEDWKDIQKAHTWKKINLCIYHCEVSITKENRTSCKLPKKRGKGIKNIKGPDYKWFLISGNLKIVKQCLQYSEGKMVSKL